jgi:6-phosphofructo-2-kinase/fructose-2,6-biphosphatase 2
MSMPPPALPTKSRSPVSPKSIASKSPQLRPTGPNSLLSDLSQQNEPVPPTVLADAISKLDNLRLSRTPSATSNPTPSASGASSPNNIGLPGVEKVVAGLGMTGVTSTVGNELGARGAVSVPGTPHFGAGSEMCVTSYMSMTGAEG